MDNFEKSEAAHKIVISVAAFFVFMYAIWVMKLLRDNFQMPKEEPNGMTLRHLLAPTGITLAIVQLFIWDLLVKVTTSLLAGIFAALQVSQSRRTQDADYWQVQSFSSSCCVDTTV